MKELYLLFLLFLIWTTTEQVIENPHSQVALQDTNVTFTCRGRGSHSILYFVKPKSNPMTDDPPLVKSNLNNYNIFIELAPPVIENGTKSFHWTIRILATPEYNLTEFFCRFVGLDESYDTDRSVLTVANESLSSPHTPQVMMSNFTHILISWSPPWVHSVNSYNVSITNKTTGITTINITHNNVLILSRDGQLLDQCHTLDIVVTANTDVGSTTSNIFHGGFPKILSPVEEETIRIEIYQRQNGSIKTEITFTKPNVCSYQVLKYSYSVKKQNNTNTTWRNYTTSILAYVIAALIGTVLLFLLYVILHQYNQHCQPIQAIDHGVHHTELVYNNYTGGYPVQVENDLYCQPIQAIHHGLYHTELVYNNYTGGYPVQVENDPYCQPIQAIHHGLYHTELVYNNCTGGYPVQVENDPYCQPIQAIHHGLYHTELVYNNCTGGYPVQVENDPYCQPIQAIHHGLYHTELVYNNYTGGYPVQVENDLYCQPIQAIHHGLYHTELVYNNYTGGYLI